MIKARFDAKALVGRAVNRGGTPRQVRITRSYNPAFDAEAVKAVKQYRFKPAKRAGEPVSVAVHVEVHFKRY